MALPAACRAGAECAVQPLANCEVWDAVYWAKQAVPALRADVGSTLGVLAMDVGLPQGARAAAVSGGTSLVTVKLKVLARDATAAAFMFIFKKFKTTALAPGQLMAARSENKNSKKSAPRVSRRFAKGGTRWKQMKQLFP